MTLVYVTVLSHGIIFILSGVMKKFVFMPGVSSYPWANHPSSLPIASCHVICVMGSLTNFSYFVIVSLVTGYTMPFAWNNIGRMAICLWLLLVLDYWCCWGHKGWWMWLIAGCYIPAVLLNCIWMQCFLHLVWCSWVVVMFVHTLLLFILVIP